MIKYILSVLAGAVVASVFYLALYVTFMVAGKGWRAGRGEIQSNIITPKVVVNSPKSVNEIKL